MISSIKKHFSPNSLTSNTFQINYSIKNYPYVIGLVFICIMVYWPVFSHQFQFFWDDQWVVFNDYTEDGFNWGNITEILSEFYHGQYAPVNEFFYLTLYSIFGYSSFWFHTASLIVHITNVLLLFSLIKKLLKMSGQFTNESIVRISLITSILFAAHPMMVESVSWMAASKCILFALFYLIALHAYLGYLNNKKNWQLGLTLLFFVISFGAKEQAVTMPVCLLLFDFVLKRDLKCFSVYLEKLPFLCLSISFAIITFYSQAYNGQGVLSHEVHYPVYQDLIFGAYTIIEYFIKILLPLKLNYIYPFPNLPHESLPAYLWLYPIVLVFVTVTYWKFWRRQWILFGVGFFLIQISIISNIIPTSRFAVLADRYIYLPSMGIFFLLAYLFDSTLKHNQRLRTTLTALIVIYIICLGTYAMNRCKVWHNSTTLKWELKQNLHNRNDYKEEMKRQMLK